MYLDKIIYGLIESDVSLLSVCAKVVTIWGFIFALPNFISQLNTTNKRTIADEALKLLLTLKLEIKKLAFCRSEKDRGAIVSRLISYFAKLKGLLNLLQKDLGGALFDSFNSYYEILERYYILERHYDDTHQLTIKFLDKREGEELYLKIEIIDKLEKKLME